ncbi:glycosyltransferase [Pararhizobium sp. A13]|uniref:glycosyltransferase n=1 Tax=Pararhizobium sp. A13 TaxID=3133975 RepID=UPI00311AC28A
MISVVMPMKEPGQFYEQAVRSILTNFPDAEIIVVGPTSAGRSPVVRADIESGRILFFQEPKKNLYSAVNLAISKASSDYIAWLNVDDEMAPISDEVIAAISQGTHDIHAFNVQFIDQNGDTSSEIVCYRSGSYGARLMDTWYCYVNSMIFRKSVLQALPFDDSYRICADRKFLFDLAQLAPSVCKHSETLVRYRRHEDSLTFNSQSRFVRRTNSPAINSELREIYRGQLAAPASVRTFLVAATRYVRNLAEPALYFMVKR